MKHHFRASLVFPEASTTMVDIRHPEGSETIRGALDTLLGRHGHDPQATETSIIDRMQKYGGKIEIVPVDPPA